MRRLNESYQELWDTGPTDLSAYIGSVIAGRYRIEHLLAEVATGSIFRVKDLASPQPTVLKILRSTGDAKDMGALHREAAILASLDHPNLVKLVGSGATKEHVQFLAFALPDGYPLAVETGRPLHPRRAAKIAADLLRGLSVLHDRGLIHRDLKPQSVFVTHDEYGQETVKIVDFGVTRAVERHHPETCSTLSGLLLGTPTYMAPEQLIGSQPDERSDLYAVGIVLYELVMGTRPWNVDDPILLFQYQLTEDVPRLPPQFGRLGTIVHRLTQREPERRYQSAQEVLADIAAYILETGIDSPPPRLAAIPTSGNVLARSSTANLRSKPRGVATWIVAVATLLLVGGAFGWLSTKRSFHPASRSAGIVDVSPDRADR